MILYSECSISRKQTQLEGVSGGVGDTMLLRYQLVETCAVLVQSLLKKLGRTARVWWSKH